MAKTNEKIGTVKSLKMQKTVVVTVEKKSLHPVYRKMVKRTKNFKADNKFEDLAVGDLVKIVSIKPISKEKFWKVVEVIRHATEKK